MSLQRNPHSCMLSVVHCFHSNHSRITTANLKYQQYFVKWSGHELSDHSPLTNALQVVIGSIMKMQRSRSDGLALHLTCMSGCASDDAREVKRDWEALQTVAAHLTQSNLSGYKSFKQSVSNLISKCHRNLKQNKAALSMARNNNLHNFVGPLLLHEKYNCSVVESAKNLYAAKQRLKHSKATASPPPLKQCASEASCHAGVLAACFDLATRRCTVAKFDHST
jgi:hypothetical protein